MTQLIIGLVLFLGTHSASIVALEYRDRMAARNEWAWKGIYALVSVVGFVLIVRGYAAARLDPVILYTPPVMLRHIAALVMLPAFACLVAPYFPGRIKTALKHPQLVAVKLWSVAHLLANGTLADVVLFGSFLAWAVVDRISMKRREQRPLPGLPASGFNDILVIVIGLGIYFAFVFGLHTYLIGVPPLG